MTGRNKKFRLTRILTFLGVLLGSGGFALATTTAHAATDSDWDRLAGCESGGNWGINTGNGFQGGLQFTPATWTAFGGQSFAPSANQATRDQQISVAEQVLASQGWGAWPTCSQKLGLNSGATARPLPSVTVPSITAPSVTAPSDTPASPAEVMVSKQTADLATSVTTEAAPELTGPAVEASQTVASTAADSGLLDELAQLIVKVRPMVRQALSEIFGS